MAYQVIMNMLNGETQLKKKRKERKKNERKKNKRKELVAITILRLR